MKVIWDSRAINGREQIADYIREHFGAKYKNLFLQHVRQTTKMLKRHPESGSIDPLFADRPRTYRSIVVDNLSKIVYFVEGDIVYIAAFWDCRKDSSAEADRVK